MVVRSLRPERQLTNVLGVGHDVVAVIVGVVDGYLRRRANCVADDAFPESGGDDLPPGANTGWNRAPGPTGRELPRARVLAGSSVPMMRCWASGYLRSPEPKRCSSTKKQQRGSPLSGVQAPCPVCVRSPRQLNMSALFNAAHTAHTRTLTAGQRLFIPLHTRKVAGSIPAGTTTKA